MFCLFVIWFSGFAQDNNNTSSKINIEIPEVALLDLEYENSSNIVLIPKSPTEAGISMNFSDAENSSVWINYSSIIRNNSGSKREVTAYIDRELPNGLNLAVDVSSYRGNGTGKMGIPASRIYLTAQAQSLIKNIGSCYTGDGPRQGHLILYSIDIQDNQSYSLLKSTKETAITVIYTLTETN